MASDSIDQEVHETLDVGDFTLDEEEMAKGEQAVTGCLAATKNADTRGAMEVNLTTLAVLISGGTCDSRDFPWHQLRSYHRTAALTILREEGIPAKIETWRCHLDEARKFHQVPTAYTGSQVQKITSSLNKVLLECHRLGYLSDEARDQLVNPPKASEPSTSKKRPLLEGEFRALAAICNMDSSLAGCRDALIFYLGFQGGLRVGEIVGVALKDLHFDKRRGQVTVRVREAKKSRARIVPLQNEALIALEDWMERRGSDDGPLLCPIRRNGMPELKRLSASQVQEICDARALGAGVEPFSAQEMRHNWELRSQAKTTAAAREIAEDDVSPLFDRSTEDEGPKGRIEFPYLGRSQHLT
jgi:integrase